MGARAQFPQFNGLTVAEFAQLLNMSKLSAEDKQIAARCIVWRMDYIDTGELVHMDRRTVARRLKTIILPELVRIMEHTRAGA